MGEKATDIQDIPDGVRWLELLGYGHLTGTPTGYEIDGEVVPVEQFDRLCGQHIGPTFRALENLDPDHPRYQAYLGAARTAFQGWFGPVELPTN